MILDLEYVEIDTEISSIARIQPEIWKVTHKSAWPWIRRWPVNTAVFLISWLWSLKLLYHYCEPWHRICGNRHRNLSNSTNPAWNMEGHAKKPVTLNLKVDGWYCRNCYMTIVILDLEYVEIDNEFSLIAQIQPEIWKLILKKCFFSRDLEFQSHVVRLNFQMPSSFCPYFQQSLQISPRSCYRFRYSTLLLGVKNSPPVTEHVVFFQYTTRVKSHPLDFMCHVHTNSISSTYSKSCAIFWRDKQLMKTSSIPSSNNLKTVCDWGYAPDYITLHYRHFKRHTHLNWPVVHQQLAYMLYEIQPTGPARGLATQQVGYDQKGKSAA